MARKTIKRKSHRKIRSIRKSRKTYRRLRGGSYAKDVTVHTFQGIPVTRNAIITSNGTTRNLKDFIKYKEDQDEEGPDL
jgi:hypothetical protein